LFLNQNNDLNKWNYTDVSHQEVSFLQGNSQEIIEAEFQNCIFKSCSFIETIFKKCKFEDCLFQHSDLSLAKFEAATFTSVKFTSSKLVGIDWRKASIPFSLDVQFDHCNISNSIFLGLNLQHIRIVECLAKEVKLI